MSRGLTDDQFAALLAQVAGDSAESRNAPVEKTYCEACKHLVKPFYRRCPKCEGDKNRESVERLAAAIQKAKANPPQTPEQERAYAKRLAFLGHPDPDGLLLAIKGSDKKPTGKRGRL